MIYAIKGSRKSENEKGYDNQFWLLTFYPDAHNNFGYIRRLGKDNYQIYFWSNEEDENNNISQGKNYKRFSSLMKIINFLLLEAKLSNKFCEAQWFDKKCFPIRTYAGKNLELPDESTFDNGTYYIIQGGVTAVEIQEDENLDFYLLSKDRKSSFGSINQLTNGNFELRFISEKENHYIESPWTLSDDNLVEILYIKKGYNSFKVKDIDEAFKIVMNFLPDHNSEYQLDGKRYSLFSQNYIQYESISALNFDETDDIIYQNNDRTFDHDWEHETWDALTDGQYGEYNGQDISEWMDKHGF